MSKLKLAVGARIPSQLGFRVADEATSPEVRTIAGTRCLVHYSRLSLEQLSSASQLLIQQCHTHRRDVAKVELSMKT